MLDIPISEATPRGVRGLLLDEGHEVKLRIIYVRLGTRIRQEPLLVQVFRDL